MTRCRKKVKTFDLFCGAGGSSYGAQMGGATIVGGIDAWETASDTFRLNFPNAKTWQDRIENIDPQSVVREVGCVDLLLASPECTNHTFAKGNRRTGPEQERSRRTSFEVIRFAEFMRPRWIVVENVVSMRRWEQYPKWKAALLALGYQVKEVTLDAQHFGVAQSRRRLFILADRHNQPDLGVPTQMTVSPIAKVLHAGEGVNGFNYNMTPLFGKGRAKDTLTRARRAMSALGRNRPFLLVYYGTDAAGGWQSLDRPLRTITTLDRFALVRPSKHGHLMRMLQPPELAAAMGFPDDYCWPDVTRRERIKLVGNAVCPPVMKHVVEAMLRS